MRILLSSLLILALPTIGAPPGHRIINTGVPEANHESFSPGTFKEVPRAPFLDLSHIIESLQNKVHPSTIDGVDQAGVAPESSLPDFWDMAKQSERTLQEYVHRLLDVAGSYFKSTKFTNVKSAMNDIVSTTATFRDNINGALVVRNITIDVLAQELEGVFTAVSDDLEKIPSPDKAPGHAERAEMVNKILGDATPKLVSLAKRYEIGEDVVMTYLSNLTPQLSALLVAVGDINEQCPQLFPMIAFSVVALLIPEMWILRPLLSLLGFGPAGPAKGSAAAWLQSRFWGAAVKPNSWFSWLQAAGMGAMPKWTELITNVPMLVGSLALGFLSCFNHG